jgi:hypothetical protein
MIITPAYQGLQERSRELKLYVRVYACMCIWEGGYVDVYSNMCSTLSIQIAD